LNHKILVEKSQKTCLKILKKFKNIINNFRAVCAEIMTFETLFYQVKHPKLSKNNV
jgi:hypothetical protein